MDNFLSLVMSHFSSILWTLLLSFDCFMSIFGSILDNIRKSNLLQKLGSFSASSLSQIMIKMHFPPIEQTFIWQLPNVSEDSFPNKLNVPREFLPDLWLGWSTLLFTTLTFRLFCNYFLDILTTIF